MPSDDFAERIAAIEQRLANLQVSDLPLAALQRKLEAGWQPSGAVLLEPKSITAELLAPGAVRAADGTTRVVAAGAGAATWSASATSAPATITHGLGRVPVAVVVNGSGGNTQLYWTGNFTPTTFDAQGWFFGGAFTGTRPFTWIAVG